MPTYSRKADRTVLVIGLFFAWLSNGCDTPAAPSAIELAPCHLERVGLRAECGTLTVPEDRAHPDGRTIDLNIARLPSLAREPAPDPLVILVGGPGQSATTSGAALLGAFWPVLKKRDILFVDQRGTGESNPLRCAPDDEMSLDEMLRQTLTSDEVRDCLEKLDADPRHYTTPVAMDDLDAVRAALGYDTVNLWGGSYGTRAALVYMRRHPEHVRRVVLDGSAPTDIKLTVHAGRDAQRALELLFDRCAADTACSESFGDIRARFDALRGELSDVPRQIELRHPRTGKLERFTLNGDDFSMIVRGILYVPQFTALLPLLLDRAANGEWEPLLAAFLAIGDEIEDLADGMFLSVVCAEDIPQITAAERERLSANFIGDRPVRLLAEVCDHWPAAEMPAEYFAPITERHPTLVLSGELDPVTPPSWGDLVTSRLPNAVHHVVGGAAHGVSTLPCVTDTMTAFLDGEDPASLELRCEAADSIELFVDPSGARP